MESWENKIWANKLNSLQDFPAGYTPDLSSKWEIIEAGLPQDKKRRTVPLLVRWSVAAAILLAVGIVWMNAGKDQQIGLAAKQDIIHPPASLLKHPAIESRLVSAGKESQLLVYHPLSEMTTIPVRGDTNRGGKITVSSWKEMIAKVEVQLAFPAPDTIIEQDALTVLPVAALADITSVREAKAVKKKIYQRDFNDGVLVMDTGFAPSSRQHFSIHLNPFRHKAADDEPPVRRLQLKQAL